MKSLLKYQNLEFTEADPRLELHAVHASGLSPNKSKCLGADDTEDFIILLSVALHLKGTLTFSKVLIFILDNMMCAPWQYIRATNAS